MLWYQNMEPFVNHVRYVKIFLILLIENLLSLDKTIIFSTGNSTETRIIKNKLISEGFKCLFSAVVSDFVVNFITDGHTA